MKRLEVLLVAILFTGNAWSQKILSGHVTSLSTRQPLEGASVWLEAESRGTLTDATGYFKLELPVKSSGTIRVSFVGYQAVIFKAIAREGMNIVLQPDTDLHEVVISAVRASGTDPVTQSTVDKKEIEKQFIGEDGAFLLEKISPSILSYSESGTGMGNYGQMRLRGIDQTRINITLNGAPLNDMIDQGVFFSNFIDFGNSIESVQVQRGVGTSTNGTSSYAGSISFESLQLDDSIPYAEVQLLGGSFNTYRASAELFSGNIGRNLSFYSRYSAFQSDGYKYHTSTNSYSFFFSGGYEGNHDRLKLTAFTGRSRNGLGYLPVAIADIETDPRTNYVNENDIDNFGQSFLQIEHVHRFHSSNLVSSVYYGGAGGDFPAGYTVTDTIFSSSSPGSYYLSERLVQVNYPLFNHHLGLTSNLLFTNPAKTLDLSGGIHIYTFHRQNLESVLPDNAHPFYDERSVKNEASIYGKASYHLGKFIAMADIQLRSLSLVIDPDNTLLPSEPGIVKSWTFINPKIGITCLSGLNTNIYLFAGQSYREPTKVDLLGGFELNPSNLASVLSDDVKPEKVINIESGVRIFTRHIRGNLNLFYMDFHNEIAPIGELVPEGFLQLRKNIASSYRRGIEMDLDIPLREYFNVKGNLTWMQSRIREYAPAGDPNIYYNVVQALSPDVMATATAGYHIKNVFEASLSTRYVSQSYLEPTNQQNLVIPEFMILSARARVSILKTHSLELIADNFLNKVYFTNGTPVDINMDGIMEPGYFVQAPRSFYFLFTFHF